MTPIVVPIFVRNAPEAIQQFRRAVAAGTTMVELRCDTAPVATIEEVLQACAAVQLAGQPLPVIVTLRSTAEGGGFAGTDADLAAAVELAARHQATYVDVEFAAWQRSAQLRQRVAAVCQHPERGLGPQIILSTHDFAGRPVDLPERIAAMAGVAEASVLKVAWTASSVTDAVEALRLPGEVRRRYGRDLVALAMGEFGQISRLLAAKFGQPFTFASLEHGAESAPGQPTVAELRTLYRWDRQRSGTPVFGVVGWPVGHSLSPHIHNAGFDQVGAAGVYVPLSIEPSYEHFAAALDALRQCPGLDLRGLSVTIPHKENAIRYVRERGGTIDPLATKIGVVNTLLFPPDGPFRGLNSDYAGAFDALVAAMGIRREDLAGQRVAVLGAGGAARAIVAGLAHYGASVVIYNRTPERARELAAEFTGSPGQVVGVPLAELCASHCHVYINCTPLGMHPHVGQCPVDQEPEWGPETVVFDTVYNPLETRLLQRARAKGAVTIPGLEMFVRQAAIQFTHFTGQAAPIETFRRILRDHLGHPA